MGYPHACVFIYSCMIVCVSASVHVLLSSYSIHPSVAHGCECVRLFADIPVENKKRGQTNDASKENWP